MSISFDINTENIYLTFKLLSLSVWMSHVGGSRNNKNMISEKSIYVDGQFTPFSRGVTFLLDSSLCQLLKQRSVTWSRAGLSGTSGLSICYADHTNVQICETVRQTNTTTASKLTYQANFIADQIESLSKLLNKYVKIIILAT